MRIWHTSIESGSDDILDNLAAESDVVGVFHTNNSLATLQLHGRNNGSCSSGLNAPPGTRVELGRLYNPYTAYATLTVAAIQKLGCGSSVQFIEPLPDAVAAGDFLSPQRSPSLLHVKNTRAGNHIYNTFNAKASAMIFEQSFLYNTTMAAVDVSTDGFYWYEGPRASNIQVRLQMTRFSWVYCRGHGCM